MKSFIAAGIAALFLAVGAVFYAIYVNNTAEFLSDKILTVENAVKISDFTNAKKYIDDFDKSLEERKTMLCAIVDHKEIHEIKRSLAEFRAFAESEDNPECLARCGEITAVINRISENTMPYISNIL